MLIFTVDSDGGFCFLVSLVADATDVLEALDRDGAVFVCFLGLSIDGPVLDEEDLEQHLHLGASIHLFVHLEGQGHLVGVGLLQIMEVRAQIPGPTSRARL
jgi:hypothetical protein